VGAVSRRVFLLRGSVAAGIAGVAAAVPGISNLFDSEAPAATDASESASTVAGALPEDATLSEPLVARVRDLQSGAMDLYIGDRQVSFTNPQVATQLFRASQR